MSNIIKTVSIAGADDRVKQKDLIALSDDFPFVEWGILNSNKKHGTARYPTIKWIDQLLLLATPGKHKFSLHLCGEVSRLALSNFGIYCGPKSLKHNFLYGDMFNRIQLNGFWMYKLPMLAIAEEFPNNNFILQVNSYQSYSHAVDLFKESMYKNISFLWDSSGGEGKSLNINDISKLYVPKKAALGIAGGLNIKNIENIFNNVNKIFSNNKIWLDLESGARDRDNNFDIKKVRKILEIISRLI